MNGQTQRLLVWSGPVLVVAFLVGLVLFADFIPPAPPTDSAEEIATRFREDQNSILAGCAIMMVGIAFFATWGASLVVWVRRMEPGFPGLTYASVACVGAGTVFFELIPMSWAVAAYRPDEVSPEVTRTINDWTWFLFLYTWPPFGLLAVLVGIAILKDHNVPRIFPRWVAFLSFWAAFLLIPATMIGFFKTGPFAYDGVFALYIPLFIYLLWMIVMSVAVLQAIANQERRQWPVTQPPEQLTDSMNRDD